MVEALIAITVLVVGFLGITDLLSRSLGLYRVTTDNYTATYLAAEGVELVKNLMDAGLIQNRAWGAIFPGQSAEYQIDYFTDLLVNAPQPYTGKFLSFDPETKLYSYAPGNQGIFRRRVVIEKIGQDEIKVNSIVDWVTRGGATFSTNVESHFFNWR